MGTRNQAQSPSAGSNTSEVTDTASSTPVDTASNTSSLDSPSPANEYTESTPEPLTANATSNGAEASSDEIPGLATDASEGDPFAQAVLIAQAAVESGKSASTSAEWLELASRWQRASDLMAQVPADDERYATAQDRQILYQTNSEEALKQASLHQAQ